MMNFAYTIFYVPDIEAALSFYEKAFGFKRKFVAPGNEYGELDTGATTLSFCVHSLAKTHFSGGYAASEAGNKPLGLEIAFTTSDVEKQYKKAVAAGAKAVAEPEEKPWGQTVAYVRDLNGFLIEICTPVN